MLDAPGNNVRLKKTYVSVFLEISGLINTINDKLAVLCGQG